MNNTYRDQARVQFIHDNGWADATVDALPCDASFRHYFRLDDGERTALLMDAPPETENTNAYVSIARHLVSLGLSAPRIDVVDETQGFVVIEDFGASTYTNLINHGTNEVPLYKLAVDVLRHLHAHPRANQIDLPPYDTDSLLNEASLLVDWYLPASTGQPTSAETRHSYRTAWRETFHALPAFEPTLVLRDYHVDNLMTLPDRVGVTRCGILDFQDALMGHPAYDLVSLLEDARRDISDELVQDMRARYTDITDTDFDAWYTVLGVQRHAKVAGIFVRLCVRDGKPVYLPHIPRVMRLLTRGLNAPALAPVQAWFQEHLPEPLAPLPTTLYTSNENCK